MVKKIVITLIILFVIAAGIFGWAYYSAYQVGKFVAPVMRKTLKGAMAINHLYQIFDIPFDSTMNVFDSTSRDYKILKNLEKESLTKNEIGLIRDAHWIKRYLDKYYTVNGTLPKDLSALKMKLPFVKDEYGKEYYYRILGNNCYVGTNGENNIWDENDNLSISEMLEGQEPLIYRNVDDMIVRLKAKKVKVDSLKLL